MQPPRESEQNEPPRRRSGWIIWIYAILVAGLAFYWFSGGPGPAEITWKQFASNMLPTGDVAKLDVINNERVEVYIFQDSLDSSAHPDVSGPGPHYYFNIGSVEVLDADLKEAQRDLPKSERVTVTYSKQENWWQGILIWVLPLVIFVLLWIWIIRGAAGRMRQMGRSMFNFGQSKARLFEKGKSTDVTFEDVAGLEEAKEEVYELVKFLKNPERYQRLGAKIPKGVLLVGPPGTGKTLLARAVAGEADVPFFSLSGSEFIEMFVGVGAARMRDLFKKAKEKAPSIIFIDEIDTIGRARGKAQVFQSNDERDSTLNQLLAELDGFDPGTGVIVLAATNRGDILDSALLRPGRFDRHIHLELPSFKERKAIFEVHLKPLTLADDVDPEVLASQTPGFSGADIANICNEAALIAARRDKEAIDKGDFADAIDRVIGGLEKKSKIISAEEKKRIAYHEAGHVTTGWFLKNTDPVLKVSIIPRGRSLGAAWYLPEEHHVITRSQLEDAISMALGGRAAEELVFSEVSSNALDDLEKVTKQAYTMVVNYGLSDRLPNLSYYDSTGQAEQSLHKPYSEKTAEKIDTEVQEIVDEAYSRTMDILREHREQLDALADALIEKETVYKEEIRKIMGQDKVS